MGISLIIVAHNEEKHITETLASGYDLVDEVILVDSGSTDDTANVVKKFDKDKKVRIFAEENAPNFIINKQKALGHASQEWVLELDADEIVTPELAKEIRERVHSPEGTFSEIAYWIPRLNYFLGKPLWKGGQYPDPTVRLYKRKHAQFAVRSVHDQVDIDGQIVPKGMIIENEKIAGLTSPLLHYPYRNITTFFRKWSQYAVYEGEQWFKDGMRPSFWNFIKWCVLMPKYWFLLTYFRHKGFMDGFPGFAFSFFSALRYWPSYMKMHELSAKKK